jgi:hypothetical protein
MKAAAKPVEKPPKNIVRDQMIWNETLKAEARHHGVNRNTEFNFNPKNGNKLTFIDLFSYGTDLGAQSTSLR